MQQITLEGKEIKDAYRYTGHGGAIRAITGWRKYVFSGSDDKTIKVYCNLAFTGEIWDTEKRSCVGTLYGHTERILALCMWNSNLVSASFDNTIKVRSIWYSFL